MKTIVIAGAAALAVTTAFAATPAAAPAGPHVPDASARLIGIDGQPRGTVLFHQTATGVRMDISATYMQPGVHAIHIHAVGKCEQGKAFTTAGGHFDVGGHQHGKLDPKGPHAGDMENITVNKYGFARTTMTMTSISLAPGPNSVFDADGSAVVIHAGPDDFKTQPAGGSGDRVACGVIKSM